jgi:hypothetical protein
MPVALLRQFQIAPLSLQQPSVCGVRQLARAACKNLLIGILVKGRPGIDSPFVFGDPECLPAFNRGFVPFRYLIESEGCNLRLQPQICVDSLVECF